MASSVRDLCNSIVAEVWNQAQKDPAFRTKLLGDPQGTLRDEGLDVIDDFINRLNTADSDALEKAIASGDTNPTC